MSTPAVVSFVLVAVAFVAMSAVVLVLGRSVYQRSRLLAQELTSLAADLERTMDTVGSGARSNHRPAN
ncbi:MAG TPA: hypothetical protein VHI11_00360 [Jiangellaceae bacterium]|nr:hypothetical protein [Jiangellaceae bacterium]